MDKNSGALARAEERSRRQKRQRQAGKDSLLVWFCSLFDGVTTEKLERAQREIMRLNEQVSHMQFRRPTARSLLLAATT
ncbi:hypothetical protein [Pyxidicoccus trucidator]|uniref:hypothetical protein n=1 Tax=Pyxidicoccus trucidator TaxID=2709662 RepID=UPI0013DD85C6|nr:hypothetical protein [Pyxidicoccus trucidator]